MQRVPLLIAFFVIWLAGETFAQDTNQITTNDLPSTASNTNAALALSDAELQEAARQVLHRIIIFGSVALVGALVVAGFALYGAYRKFGITGVTVVCIILAFGAFVFGGFLLLF